MMIDTSTDLKERVSLVETYLAHVRRDLRLPGLSVSIVQHGEVMYTAGFGMAAPGRAVSAHTPFLLGSLSKSFTALATMQLVERKLVDLDMPVRRYIPWFTVASPGVSSITVRDLLTHTSGLSRYVGRDLLSGRGDMSIEQSVRALSAVSLVHTPGVQFEYSNSNYLVLACLIETVSGLSYPAYLERFVFGLLSMHDSAAVTHVPGLAQGHRWWYGWPFPFNAPFSVPAMAAAFLTSSASDMARWLLLHLSDGSLDGVRLLSSAALEVLHAPSVSIKKRGSTSMAAMGWRVETLEGERILRHGGEVSNFRADMVLVPGLGLGVVTLQNCNNGLVAQLGLDQIALNVLRLLLGVPVPKERFPLRRFYLGLDLGLVVLTLLHLWLWSFLALSGRPTTLSLVLVAFSSLWPLLALLRLPRAADMPWRGLRLYVPDLSWWVVLMGVATLLINASVVLRWLF